MTVVARVDEHAGVLRTRTDETDRCAGIDAATPAVSGELIFSRSAASVAWRCGCSGRPGLWLELDQHGVRWLSTVGISRIVAVTFLIRSTRARAPCPASSRVERQQFFVGDATPHEARLSPPPRRAPHRRPRWRTSSAARRCVGTSRCGRRRGGSEVQEAGVEAGPRPRRGGDRTERQVHSGADGGAVDGGDVGRGQRPTRRNPS